MQILALWFAILTGFIIRPVFAQQVMDFLKEKAGFMYGNNAEFVFVRETPNYIAYAGDKASAGGHRIMLAQDHASVEFSFLSATGATPSARPMATNTQGEVLFAQALSILTRQASGSAIREDGITTEERSVLTSAAAALPLDTTGISGQEQQDFLLYIKLQERSVAQQSQRIDTQFQQVVSEAHTLLAKATLEENDRIRKVVFRSIANGIDMAYLLNENGIGQDIIIHSASEAASLFSFSLNPHGLSYKDAGHGVWYFSDAVGYVMRFASAYAKDATGAFTNDVRTDIANGIVTLTVPPQWLADQARVYPVTVHNALEVVPELREENAGAGDLRALHVAGVPTATPAPTAAPTPTPTSAIPPVPRDTPAPTLSPEPAASLSATPEASPSGEPAV